MPLWSFPHAAAWALVARVVLGLAVVVTVVTGLDIVAKAVRLRRTSPRTAMKRAAPGGRPPMTIAAGLVAALTARSLTIATAESLTGGLVCAALTEVPGASAVVRGGVVAYATDLKAVVLGVDPDLLAAGGAVQEEVARQMALGVCRLLGAAVGVATTGVAGPDPQDGRPVGTVFVAVARGGEARVVSRCGCRGHGTPSAGRRSRRRCGWRPRWSRARRCPRAPLRRRKIAGSPPSAG